MHRRRGTGTTAIVWVIVGSPGCAYRTGASDSAAPRAGPGVTRSPLRVGASTLCAVLTQRNLSLRLEGHEAHGTTPPGAISRTVSPHYRRAGSFVEPGPVPSRRRAGVPAGSRWAGSITAKSRSSPGRSGASPIVGGQLPGPSCFFQRGTDALREPIAHHERAAPTALDPGDLRVLTEPARLTVQRARHAVHRGQCLAKALRWPYLDPGTAESSTESAGPRQGLRSGHAP